MYKYCDDRGAVVNGIGGGCWSRIGCSFAFCGMGLMLYVVFVCSDWFLVSAYGVRFRMRRGLAGFHERSSHHPASV